MALECGFCERACVSVKAGVVVSKFDTYELSVQSLSTLFSALLLATGI